MQMPEAEMKWVVCDTCGKDVPCNAAYPVSQITCFRCRIEKKWRHKKMIGNIISWLMMMSLCLQPVNILQLILNYPHAGLATGTDQHY